MNQMTKGSRLKVHLMNDNIPEIDGTFEGFFNLGEDSAILVKSDNELKIIPVASIAFLEISEFVEEKKGDDSNKNVTYFA